MDLLASLHPKVIHFPVALLITYILFELTGIVLKKEFYLKAALRLLILGVVGLFFAVLTGNQAFAAYKFSNYSSRELLANHQTYANITVWYFTGLLVLRIYLGVKKKLSGNLKYLILLFAIAGGYLVFQTAEYGGDLVQKFGVGTELSIEKLKTND